MPFYRREIYIVPLCSIRLRLAFVQHRGNMRAICDGPARLGDGTELAFGLPGFADSEGEAA